MAQPFGHDIPRLSWIGAKTYKQHGLSRSGNSGHGMEHAAANKENLLRTAEVLAHIEDQPVILALPEGK
jgi:hypothetical protein